MASSHDEKQQSPGQQPHIYRPVPRRNFEPLVLRDADDSPTHAFSAHAQDAHSPVDLQKSRSSDFLAQLNARLLRTYHSRTEDAPESPVEGGSGSGTASARLPRQNKSFLNMNSSTLFGIYDDVGAQSSAETPWGTGAETPGHTGMGWNGAGYEAARPADPGLSMKSASRAGGKDTASAGRRRSSHTRRARSGVARYAVLFFKLAALFTFGVLYGLIVSHLHDTRQLAAVHVTGVDRKSWVYVIIWGCAGVGLGSLLPYVDLLWSRHSTSSTSPPSSSKSNTQHDEKDSEPETETPISEQINDVVRSVAAFVGVAFAIRRLPWQSTLQLTLTLALVNPALWYILDRSKPGLSFSLIATSLLTSLVFLSNPTALPSPSTPAATNATHAPAPPPLPEGLLAGVVSYESVAVVTWVGSVLFCSCVCFGSIGRRLGVLEVR